MGGDVLVLETTILLERTTRACYVDHRPGQSMFIFFTFLKIIFRGGSSFAEHIPPINLRYVPRFPRGASFVIRAKGNYVRLLCKLS